MSKSNLEEIKKSIEISVNKALKKVGLREFKKCSFFISNRESKED